MRIKKIDGLLKAAGQNAWKINGEVLRAGTVLEIRLSGRWLLGLLQLSKDSICRFLSWEDGVEIGLRPGLRARALMSVCD